MMPSFSVRQRVNDSSILDEHSSTLEHFWGRFEMTKKWRSSSSVPVTTQLEWGGVVEILDGGKVELSAVSE